MADSSYVAERVIQVSNRTEFIDYVEQYTRANLTHVLNINSLVLNRKPISVEIVVGNLSDSEPAVVQFVNNANDEVVDWETLDPSKETILKYVEGYDLGIRIKGDVKIEVTGEVI